MMRLSCLVIVGAMSLFLTGAGSSAIAHPGHFYSAFHAKTLDQAFELASTEGKLVFVYVGETGSSGCPLLRWPTEAKQRLGDTLIQESIIVELEATKDAEAIAPYDLQTVPAILLLSAEGELLANYSGRLPVDVVHERIISLVSKSDALPRVRSALENLGENHFFSRERLARTCARLGLVDEAIAEYQWCMNRSVNRAGAAAVARRPFLFDGFATFAITNDKARIALNREREEIENLLLGEYPETKLARDLAVMNQKLGDEAHTLALFDRMEPANPARRGLFDSIMPLLVEKGRHDEVLTLIDPIEAFRGEVMLARRQEVSRAASPDAHSGRGSRRFAIDRGRVLLQALAESGRTDDAKQLVDEIVSFDNRPSTVARLTDAITNSESNDLAEYVRSKAE